MAGWMENANDCEHHVVGTVGMTASSYTCLGLRGVMNIWLVCTILSSVTLEPAESKPLRPLQLVLTSLKPSHPDHHPSHPTELQSRLASLHRVTHGYHSHQPGTSYMMSLCASRSRVCVDEAVG